MIQSPLIQGVATLFGFQLAGELLVRFLHVPIPGPIAGLLLLFAFLRARVAFDLREADALETTARAFQIDPVAGTFAGMALCLNAILTALIMPALDVLLS